MVERDNVSGEGRDWRARAACRGGDGEIFFPTAEAGPELERAEATAKRICAGCPVRAQCLAWAIEVLPFGIAGGLGEGERASLRRTGRRAGRSRRTLVALPGPARAVRGDGRASEQRETGCAALAAGRDRDQVAAECGVSRRTVDRWAAALRDVGMTADAGVGVGGAQ